MSGSENLSYNIPREPSIKCWGDRVKLTASYCKANVFKLGLDDYEGSRNEKLKVYLRLKPCKTQFNPYTVTQNSLEAEAPKDSNTYKNLAKKVGKIIHRFHFTSVLNENASQEKVFETCVLDSLKRFVSGENDLLFAYGTTNAGKTFTMQGTAEAPGIIPRAMKFVFNCFQNNIEPCNSYQPTRYSDIARLDEEQRRKEVLHKSFILNLDLEKYQKQPELSYRSYLTETTSLSSSISDCYENASFREMESNLGNISYEVSDDRYSLWISMIEIYNEHVHDLLEIPDERAPRVKLGYAEDECGNVYIRNLRYINVLNWHEAYQIFQFGKANLHSAPTALNMKSSRSHCICTMTLARYLDFGKTPHALLSRFSFCDLAGIERVKKALNVGHRLAESKSINTSLSIFAKCIAVIKDNQTNGEKKIVPYRESKLTRLFRDAMMGREKLSLVINVTPEPHLFDETMNVLKFSAMAQKIVPLNPINKKLKPLGKTRFSMMVSKANDPSKIIWEASTVIENQENNDRVDAFEQLLNLIDKLKQELADERSRSQNIEKELREELTSKFSELMRKHAELSSNHLVNETKRIQDMYERKKKRLVEFYEKQERAKRKRFLDDPCDCSEADNELMAELENLKSENDSLRDMVLQLRDDNNKLHAKCTQLEFNMCDKDKTISLYKKNREESDAGDNLFVKELEVQLAESQMKVKELRELLEESAVDYKDLLESNKYVKEENENLQRELATTSTVVEDLKNELQDYQKMLFAKTGVVEKLESRLEKLNRTLTEERERQLEVWQTREKELTQKFEDEKLEINKKFEESEAKLKEMMTSQIEALSENDKNVSEKLRLEKWVKELKENIICLEKEVEDLKRQNAVTIKTEVMDSGSDEEDKVLVTELENLRNKNEALSILCDQQSAEIKLLEKSTKILNNKILELSKNEEKHFRNEDVKSENCLLLEQIENYKRSKADLEKAFQKEVENTKVIKNQHEKEVANLQKRLEAVELNFNNMKNMKDEAERKAYELPSLEEQIQLLEKEIKNKEKEMEVFQKHREELFEKNENEIQKLMEENDMLRKDVHLTKENLVKNDKCREADQAEIARLKELLGKKDEEINTLTNEKRNYSKIQLKASKFSENISLDLCSNKKNPLDAQKINVPRHEHTPDRLSREIQKLSLLNSESKKLSARVVNNLEESMHPSLIKSNGRSKKKGRKPKDKEERLIDETVDASTSAIIKGEKCSKKLFTDNDFDNIGDLDSSFVEPDMPRLRPRRK